MSIPAPEALRVALEAARRARSLLREAMSVLRAPVGGEGRDLKVAADRESESLLLSFLRSESGWPVLSEETGWSGVTPGHAEGPTWIVDPLDGSFNYSRGIPIAAVSIALWQKGRPLLGVVSDVFRDETFAGGPELQTKLNDQVIRVSTVLSFRDAVFCTGLPVAGDFCDEAVQSLVSEMRRFKKVRYLGSASLSLAYVASGRADVYRESGIRLWDVAAGLALVQGAGGFFTAVPWSQDETILDVRADNGRLAETAKPAPQTETNRDPNGDGG